MRDHALPITGLPTGKRITPPRRLTPDSFIDCYPQDEAFGLVKPATYRKIRIGRYQLLIERTMTRAEAIIWTALAFLAAIAAAMAVYAAHGRAAGLTTSALLTALACLIAYRNLGGRK